LTYDVKGAWGKKSLEPLLTGETVHVCQPLPNAAEIFHHTVTTLLE